MVSDSLLSILRCPESGTPLKRADEAMLAALNQAVAAGTLKNRGGETVQRTLDGGLVRDDGRLLYPVVDEIPRLLIDEAIELDQLAGA